MRNYLTSLTAQKVRRHYASGEWRSDTLLDMVARNATLHPDALSVVDSSGALSYREFLDAVVAAAGFLDREGVQAGAPVLIQLANCLEHAVASVAISALGAVRVPLSHGLLSTEVVAVASRVGAQVILCSDRQTERLAEAGADTLQVVTASTFRAAMTSVGSFAWRAEDTAADADAVLDLMFTSGTTGQPKGIINSTNTKFSAVRAFVAELGLGPDDAWLVVPPMSHNAGWLYSFAPSLVTGGPIVLQETFEPGRTLQLLREFDVKCVFLTPTHATDVLAAVRSGAQAPSDLRYVLMGSAVTTTSIRVAVREELGAKPLTLYGSTENQAATFTRPDAPWELTEDSVGTACHGTEVAIFGQDRRTQVGTGVVGHIGTRGAGTFLGYFDNQAATDASFNGDDWFFAGDLGMLDEHGRLHITGRDKEIIIRGGLNIVPDDVEAALREFPNVRMVAAVGIPDERLGERVCLVVVGDEEVGLPAITSYLEVRGVGKNLWPEALLHVDEFPLTEVGKVKRSALRADAVEALAAGTLELVDRGQPRGGPGRAEA